MRKRPTPETDAVAAYEGNWDTKALRMTAHSRKLERERDELRQWKKEMLLIESQWDEQIVGRLLGLQLGDYIKPNIEPKLRQLIRERDEARADVRLITMDESFYAAKCIEVYATITPEGIEDLWPPEIQRIIHEMHEVGKRLNGNESQNQ